MGLNLLVFAVDVVSVSCVLIVAVYGNPVSLEVLNI